MIKNIYIQALIRGIQPESGTLPTDIISIDLVRYKSKINKDYLSLPFMYNVIQQIIANNNITLMDTINLFIVAPNSVNVIVPFILSKLGYKYNILPKSTNSKQWGFVDNDVELKGSYSFLHEMKVTDSLMDIDCCIKLQGKFPINGEQQVYIPKLNKNIIIKRILTQVNNIDEYNKIYVTYNLKLPQIYTSLTDKKVCQQFEDDIKQIMNELLTKKVQRIHILSSIPAYGLQIMGKIIAQEDFRDMCFCLYDYENKNQYNLVSAINTKALQELINKGE